MYNGIMNVYKEAGFTSHDVVAKLRGICKQKKIGHTGTLDPDAVGVLPVCFGSGTKLCDMLTDWDKEYIATLQLGIVTDTQDISGQVLSKADPEKLQAVTEGRAAECVMSFLGEYDQKGLMLGAVDYIVKPFHPQIVKARVNTHIKLYQYRKQVEDQSMTDQLTGVANRRGHDRYTVVKWSEAIRLGVPMSICMFDIDKFKVYNDTFGHPAGDKVIAAVAGVASGHLRRSVDFFARYGGEEFVAVLMGESSQKSFEHLKAIRRAIEATQIPHNPEVSPWVTVSIGGVTVCPQWEDSYATYLQLADTMLYDAKRMGRNRVVWMDENMRQLVEE